MHTLLLSLFLTFSPAMADESTAKKPMDEMTLEELGNEAERTYEDMIALLAKHQIYSLTPPAKLITPPLSWRDRVLLWRINRLEARARNRGI